MFCDVICLYKSLEVDSHVNRRVQYLWSLTLWRESSLTFSVKVCCGKSLNVSLFDVACKLYHTHSHKLIILSFKITLNFLTSKFILLLIMKNWLKEISPYYTYFWNNFLHSIFEKLFSVSVFDVINKFHFILIILS